MLPRIYSRNLPEVKDAISKIALGLRGIATEVAAKYFLGDSRHGLRHEPPEKRVSRARAYGDVSKDGAPPGYFSWKQFRLVKAKQAKGEIPYQRTHTLAPAWEMKGEGANTYLFNDKKPAVYAFGEPLRQQARQLGLVGWRWWKETIMSNMAGAIQAVNAAVRKLIENRGKK